MPNKTYKRVLGAVALLGSETPGVYNLSDIIANYANKESDSLKIYDENAFDFKLINFSKKGNIMDEKQIAKLELDLETKTKELETEAEKAKTFAADLEKAKSELEDLKKFKADADKKAAEALAEAQKAKTEKFVTELESAKLITPAMKPYVMELLGEEKKEYTVKVQDKETKLEKADLLKETLKLFKASSEVNFEESSEEGDKKSYAKDESDMDKEAKEYAKENKVSYGQAMKEVMKKNKKK